MLITYCTLWKGLSTLWTKSKRAAWKSGKIIPTKDTFITGKIHGNILRAKTVLLERTTTDVFDNMSSHRNSFKMIQRRSWKKTVIFCIKEWEFLECMNLEDMLIRCERTAGQGLKALHDHYRQKDKKSWCRKTADGKESSELTSWRFLTSFMTWTFYDMGTEKQMVEGLVPYSRDPQTSGSNSWWLK